MLLCNGYQGFNRCWREGVMRLARLLIAAFIFAGCDFAQAKEIQPNRIIDRNPPVKAVWCGVAEMWMLCS